MAESIVLSGENVVNKLASSFPENEQKEIARDMFLAMNMKGVTVKNEEGKNVKQKFDAFQALSYVMACRDLGLNPVLNHVIMLEDQFYITLQGHLQNAHKTGQLAGLVTELLSSDPVKVRKWDWKSKAFVETTVRQFRYRCTVTKRVGESDSVFTAEGVADETNVTGGDKATELKIEQMAEARAMRRTLARAFPVGLSNYEDVLEADEIGVRIYEEKSEAKAEAGKLMAGKKKAPSVKDSAAVKEAIDNTPAGGVVFVDGNPSEIANAINAKAEETAAESQAAVYEKATGVKPEIVKPDPEPTAQTAPATESDPDDGPLDSGISADDCEKELAEMDAAAANAKQAEEVAEVFGETEAPAEQSEEREPTLSELEDKVMIARVEFNRTLSEHKANPTPENEAKKTAAAAEVVRLNRLISAKNGG